MPLQQSTEDLLEGCYPLSQEGNQGTVKVKRHPTHAQGDSGAPSQTQHQAQGQRIPASLPDPTPGPKPPSFCLLHGGPRATSSFGWSSQGVQCSTGMGGFTHPPLPRFHLAEQHQRHLPGPTMLPSPTTTFCCPLLGTAEGCADPAAGRARPKAPAGCEKLPDRCPNLSEIKEGQSGLGVTAAASAASKCPSSHCVAFPGHAAHPAWQAPSPPLDAAPHPGPQALDTLRHTQPQPRTAALQSPSPREISPSSPRCFYCLQSLGITN